jgi:hypothetical protein
MNRRRLLLISALIEVVGIAIGGSGLGIELAMHADIGYVCITTGAVTVAAGGLILNKVIRGAEFLRAAKKEVRHASANIGEADDCQRPI